MWDVGHAPKDQSNRRKYMPDYAVWEIHPGDETGRSALVDERACQLAVFSGRLPLWRQK